MINELFSEQYNRERYFKFLRDKFKFSELIEPVSTNNNDVESFEQLGSITTHDRKTLPVFEIHIKPDTKLERNRVGLRNLVAKEVGTDDGALAVYVDEKNQQWRFSFIAIEYELTEEGVKKQQTASKRFTYLFGKGAKTRTAQERFKLLNKTSTLEHLKAAFSVEPLNKEFYGKLDRWYETAQQQVKFPNDENAENHIQTSLIRFLTRILFIWFLKEKKLINPDLFELAKLENIIDWQQDSCFYKAILQNLFFATLSTKIEDRKFRSEVRGHEGFNPDFGNQYVFRYQKLFKDLDKIKSYFDSVPFLNGGLFECLDDKKNKIYIDGFSRTKKCQPVFNNELFFNNDKTGLIDLFNQYQFTIEESTPLDIEVALDPELLGKVFENLLASYNPETGDQARKATGSFYTPREIVSYMVDESLKQHFKTHTNLDTAINQLFIEGENELKEAEIQAVIKAIDDLKILDPAVGSGAFPMGILQRLVFILEKIDPENTHFKNQQLTKTQTMEPASKEASIVAIEQIFSPENQYNAYSKKLVLIENCIYGVDIQPIAIQICKLRFFISLTIEQNPNSNSDDNYGIKALPNLETKFIVANTLLPLGGSSSTGQMGLFDAKITKLQRDLAKIRHQYFTAKTLDTKHRCRKQDQDLREKMLETLTQSGITPAVEKSMQKVVAWDLYNQNAVADWFDPEWMFGIKDGFDIVLGNPPYLRVQGIEKEASRQYKTIFKASTGSYDLYVLFAEKGLSLLTENGILNYIMPHKWVNSAFGKGLREISKNNIYKLVSFEAYQVFNASTYTSLVWFGKSKSSALNYIGLEKNLDTNQELEKYLTTLSNKDFLKIDNQTLNSDSWILTSQQNHDILEKINQQPLKVSDIFERIFQGIATSKDSVYFLTDIVEKDQLIECYSKELDKRILIEKVLVKPLLKGDDVHRYETLSADKIVIFPYYITSENNKERAVLYSEAEIKNKFPNGYRYLKECEDVLRNRESGRFDIDGEWFQYGRKQGILFANKEKIITPYLSLSSQLSYDKDGEFYGNTKCFGLIKHLDAKGSYKFYLAILNSQLTWFFIKNTSSIMSGGYFTYTKDSLSSFPLPRIANLADTKPFEKLVDKIIIAKKTNQDSSDLEAQIDKLVYKLYNLTTAEIKILENENG